MSVKSRAGSRFKALAVLSVVMGLCASLLAAPARAAGTLATQATGSEPTQADFCATWDAIQAAQGQGGVQVTLSNGTMVSADDASLTGASCTASNAEIDLTGAALSQGAVTQSATQQASTFEATAASTAPTLEAGSEILTGMRITWLSLTWSPWTGINLSGGVQLTFTHTVVNLGFTGLFQNLENWSASVFSLGSGTELPVVTGTVAFRGTFGVQYGPVFVDIYAESDMLGVDDVTLEDFVFDVFAVNTNPPQVDMTMAARMSADDFSASVDLDFVLVGGEITFDLLANFELSSSEPTSGALAASGYLHPDGNFLIEGSGDVTVGDYAVRGLTFRAEGTADAVSVDVEGDLLLDALTVRVAGDISTNAAGDAVVNLVGRAAYRFGYEDVGLARFALYGSRGSAQTVVGFNVTFLGFITVGFAAYLAPDGRFERVRINGILWWLFLNGWARNRCGCEVVF